MKDEVCPFCTLPIVKLITECITSGKLTDDMKDLIACDPAAQLTYDDLDMDGDGDDF